MLHRLTAKVEAPSGELSYPRSKEKAVLWVLIRMTADVSVQYRKAF